MPNAEVTTEIDMKVTRIKIDPPEVCGSIQAMARRPSRNPDNIGTPQRRKISVKIFGFLLYLIADYQQELSSSPIEPLLCL